MKITWYPGAEKQIEDSLDKALEMTGAAIVADLVQSQTLPFAEDSESNRRRGVVPGALQGSISVEHSSKNHVRLLVSQPYARRLYYHPEYNFYRGTNKLASGLWWQPYLKGTKLKWTENTMRSMVRKVRGQ